MAGLTGHLFVYHAVLQFGEFSAVPSACGSDEVTCDTLEFVDVMSAAVRTFGETLLCILETAVHTSVAVMIDLAVSDFVSVHEIHD